VTQPDQRLAGRTGLITGAASGIGAAGADLFAAHGAALVLLDTDRAGGQRVADAITARGGRAVFHAGDAASPDDVARAALFLSCAESSFTTGTPLLVDGGVTA